MKLVFLKFDTRIDWRIDDDDPDRFQLPTTKDWLLLSPLLYESLGPPSQSNFSSYAPGKYFGETLDLVFVSTRDFSKQKWEAEDTKNMWEIALDLLTRLRHISGQASMPRAKNAALLVHGQITDIPNRYPRPVNPFPDRQFEVNKYLFEVSITAKHIQDAMALGPIFEAPIYESLLLDAVVAYKPHENQIAILYAAMSMEVALGSVIKAEYERILSGSKNDKFRVINTTISGGATVTKDPVYKYLNASNNFDLRLHELPLYILGRSLRSEDENLYSRARTLYDTRNGIAHSGIVETSGPRPVLTLDSAGSWEALTTAIDVFSWLRLPKTVILPEFDFVPPSDMQL